MHEGMARWLSSFSELVGIIILKEKNERVYKRIKREVKRVGILRFADVILFRFYYRLFCAKKDAVWEHEQLSLSRRSYPANLDKIPVLETHSPNSKEARRFIENLAPDIMIARCKTILRKSIFSIPTAGTFVMHPGICPEYRNAHGCFWALANDDLENVGMTLLKVDKGVDTGSVFGYYTYDFDEINESHNVIQHRVVLENLKEMEAKLVSVFTGEALPLDTAGRKSATWGQPWLTAYLKWKYKARRRKT